MEKFYDIPVLGGFGARYFLWFKANGILKRHMIVTHTLKHNSYIYQYIFFFFTNFSIFDFNFIAVIY